MAMSIARNVETTEPKMAAKAPNLSTLGAHSSFVMKSNPKAFIASVECSNKTTKIHATMKRISSALKRVML